MKVLVDTNVLISAVIKKDSVPNVILRAISVSDNYEMFLTDQNIAEFRDVVNRKMPRFSKYIDMFLAKLNYEIIATIVNTEAIAIRDVKDQPILNAAILNNLDVIITGDKDFLALDMEYPKCIAPTDFYDAYIK